MNIDLYTKTVLTVIAGCLLYLVAKDVSLIPAARAGSGPIDVNIVEVSGSRVHISPLPVKIAK